VDDDGGGGGGGDAGDDNHMVPALEEWMNDPNVLVRGGGVCM
jgi:hypothetical protein